MKDSPMNCERFSRWLEAGRPAADALAEADHAAGCTGCREALAAERAIEALLSAAPVAPEGFTDRVMRAVDAASAARAHAPAPAWNDALPWWARAAIQPSALGAAALAALLAWRPDAIEQGGRLGVASLTAAGQIAASWLSEALGPAAAAQPMVQTGLLASAALVFAVAALPLYHWTERVAARRG